MCAGRTIDRRLCITVGKVEKQTNPTVMNDDIDEDVSTEDDPELERELQELAQWLLDVYLWKLEKERREKKET